MLSMTWPFRRIFLAEVTRIFNRGKSKCWVQFLIWICPYVQSLAMLACLLYNSFIQSFAPCSQMSGVFKPSAANDEFHSCTALLCSLSLNVRLYHRWKSQSRLAELVTVNTGTAVNHKVVQTQRLGSRCHLHCQQRALRITYHKPLKSLNLVQHTGSGWPRGTVEQCAAQSFTTFTLQCSGCHVTQQLLWEIKVWITTELKLEMLRSVHWKWTDAGNPQ